MPAEWESQSCVMLTFPHAGTDWDFCLSDAIRVFSDIIRVVSHYEPVLLVCEDISLVRSQLHPDTDFSRLLFAEMPSNDTWARDHAPISVFADDTPVILDFRFNAWGLKFPADKDNLITRNLFFSYRSLFSPSVKYGNSLDIVLEGGSIESDGCGTIMTSSQCLLAPNRNEQFSQDELEEILKSRLGANEILWVNNGNIDGDDTDGHIDTLCRFCSPDSIAYVSPPDESDDYYYDFLMMENELKSFRTSSGAPYRLFPLPNFSY